jgi:hypothetical protein
MRPACVEQSPTYGPNTDLPFHIQLTIDLNRGTLCLSSFVVEQKMRITAFGQFTVPDLSAIARNLDEIELSYNEDRRRRRSGNMDDTGGYRTSSHEL